MSLKLTFCFCVKHTHIFSKNCYLYAKNGVFVIYEKNDFFELSIDEIVDVWYKYASANPQITVDTFKLRDYAQRIKTINNRVVTLDKRLDALYSQVGLQDLWNLLQANILMGYSWRLLRCSSYLKETAEDMEAIEKKLTNQL